jgi:nicotinamide-nucleotide amidase
VVAYNTVIKHSVLGVSADLLAANGAVDPEVARQMAVGVRRALAVGGVGADVGLATTGVAGPDPQDGQPVGTVYIAVAMEGDVVVEPLLLSGSRSDIRAQTVELALQLLLRTLG